MKKYRTPNGQVVDESVLREKYGNRFDSLVSNGTFTVEEDKPSGILYTTPNGKEADETTLKNKYGSEFETLVGNGTFKKKDEAVSETGGELAAISSTGSMLGSGLKMLPKVNGKIPDIAEQKPDFSNFKWIPGQGLVQKEKYATVVIPGNDKAIPIVPEMLPDGYPKTPEGAAAYASSLQARLLQASVSNAPGSDIEFKKAFDEAARMDAVSSLIDSRASLNKDDIAAISKYIPSFNGVATDEVLNTLSTIRRNIMGKYGGMFPEHPENFNKDAREADAIGYYMNKLSRAIPTEVSKNMTQIVIGADTRSKLNKFASGLQENIEVAMDREKVENLGNEFFTGLEALKRRDVTKYKNIVKRIESGKTLASIEVAELTNDGAEIINNRNVERLSRNEIDINQYFELNEKTAKTADENFYRRPDILQRSIANVIGKFYEKDGGVVIGKWNVTDNEIDEVPASVFAASGIDINRPEAKAAIQKIKDNEGILPFDNAIQKDDLLRETFKGFVQPIKGVVETIGGIGKSDNTKIIERKLEPIANYANQRGEYFNRKYGMLADAFNGAGQFISQYLLMEAGVGAFKGLGSALGGTEATVAVMTPEAASATAIRQGTKIGNYIMDKSQLYSKLAVPYLQSYDANYKTALERTNNPTAAKVMAFVNSSMESLSEQMFDNIKFGREVVGNFKKNFNPNRIAKIFDRGVIDNVSMTELKQTVGDVFKQSMKTVGKSFGETVKEASEEIVPAFSDYVTTAIANPDAVKDRDVVNEMKDAFVAGFVSFSLPGLVGAGSRLKSQFASSETENFALTAAAMNRDLVMDALGNQLEDGGLSPDDYNSKVRLLNTATKTLSSTPKFYSDGDRMSQTDVNDYLANTVRIKYLRQEAQDTEDDSIKKTNEEKINELNSSNFDIIHQISNQEQRLAKKRDVAVSDEDKLKVEAEIQNFSAQQKQVNGGKTFTDFDGTVWDEDKKELTPLGQELKNKIESGEDVTVLTAREDNEDNEKFIADTLGIPASKVILGLRPKEKAEYLVPGSTFYDNNESNVHWANKRVGVNVVKTGQDSSASQNQMSADDINLFDRVHEKNSPLNSFLDVNNKQSIDELKDQSLSTPASINEKLGDRKLAVELIASNGEEKVNAKITELEEELKQEGNTELRIGEIDNHLSLLDDALVKLQEPEGSVIHTNAPTKQFGIGFAPFRAKNVSTEEEDTQIRSSEDYKLHQDNVRKISEGIGVPIISNRNTWGGYVDSETGNPVQEVSNAINIDGDLNQARLVAAILGKAAPEQQDSVLIGEYDENGSGIEHTISTGSFENARNALQYLKQNGLEYFTIDKDTGDIIIIDTDNSNPENITNFIAQLKENGIQAEHTLQPINAEFIGSQDYDSILSGQGSEVGNQKGFDIDSFVKEARQQYEDIKQKGVKEPAAQETKPEKKSSKNKAKTVEKIRSSKRKKPKETEQETVSATDIQDVKPPKNFKGKIIKYLKKIIPILEKVVPGIKVSLIDDESEYHDVTGSKDSRGLWNRKEKKIYLNLPSIQRTSKKSTHFHEAVHVILDAITHPYDSTSSNYIKGLAEGVRGLKLDGLENVLAYADSIDEDKRDLETVTEFIAHIANGNIKIPKSTSIMMKVVDLINKFLEYIGSSIHVKYTYQVPDVIQLARDISNVFKGKMTVWSLGASVIKNNQNNESISEESESSDFDIPDDVYDESIEVIAKEFENNQNISVSEAINRGIRYIESQGITDFDKAGYINSILETIYDVDDKTDYYEGLDEEEKNDYDAAIKSGNKTKNKTVRPIRERIEAIEPAITGMKSEYSAAGTFKEAGFGARGRIPEGETTRISNIVEATMSFIHQFDEETGGNGVRELVEYLGFTKNRRKSVRDLDTEQIRTNKHFSLVNVLYGYIQNSSPTEIGLSPQEIVAYSKYLKKLSFSMGRTIGQDLNTAKLRNVTESLLYDMVMDSMFSDNENDALRDFDAALTEITDGNIELTDEDLLVNEIIGDEKELEKQVKQSEGLSKVVKLSEQLSQLQNKPVSEKRSKKISDRIKIVEEKIKELINKIPCD